MTAVPPCTHIWVRISTGGTGTSPETTLWGPTTCVNCGATYEDDHELREAVEADEETL